MSHPARVRVVTGEEAVVTEVPKPGGTTLCAGSTALRGRPLTEHVSTVIEAITKVTSDS